MAASLPVALFAFEGVQILDVTGPASVFAAANDAVGSRHYQVHVLSARGGVLQSNSAIGIATRPLKEIRPASIDTLLIAGGEDVALLALADDKVVRRWIERAAAGARRYGSICTGAFVLAHFGLTAERRVATHWGACALLAQRYPGVNVDANALYVEDGRLWTSAGVTTGIDMSLAMVERDLGSEVAAAIAKRLVLYVRRPGFQSQFSPVLAAQARAGSPFGNLIQWMSEHLTHSLDVPRLAARMAMSDRTFHRQFTQGVGATPARFVETLRLDRARQLLGTRASLKEIASQAGFPSAATFSQAFERRFGVTPTLFREMHVTLVQPA
jgi:transcriptional regulator GlxA family with amidase domain